MRVAILYCGSTHIKSLVDRCVSCKVSPIVLKASTPAAEVAALGVGGIIISGSPWSVLDIGCPKVDLDVYNLHTPVLGVCYGMQRMAADLGGEVVRFPIQEKDEVLLALDEDNPSHLYKGFTQAGVDVWMAHSCQVRTMPDGFVRTGATKKTLIASMERDNTLFAVQFHPEKDGNGSGRQVLTNFLREICGSTDE